MSFETAWKKTGRAEAGFANNPNDSGGPTNHGITEATARAYGYEGDMRSLSKELATKIAKQAYWDIMKLDEVAAVSEEVADELFDTGFLCGIQRSGLFFQKALNCFNRSHKPHPDYAEVTEDGMIGARTIYAFRQFITKRGALAAVVMLRCLNSQQGTYLMELARRREKDEEFTFGWFLNRVII